MYAATGAADELVPSVNSMNRPAIHIAGGAVRAGMAAFTVGLLSGGGLIGRYFWVTPFAVCSASLATGRVTEIRPWALP